MARIDHFFVFSQQQAPEQQRLLDRGLRIGVRRDHRGQGTSNVCFGFADSFLELLWLADEKGARLPMVKPLGLQERARWRETKASPFGICVRPSTPLAEAPFAHWDYRPEYLPDDMHIQMGCNSGVIGEPLLFQIDRVFAPFEVEHELADKSLSSLVITTPDLAPMSLLHDLVVDRLELKNGDEHLMEVTLDGGAGQQLDLRPDLPLVLRW